MIKRLIVADNKNVSKELFSLAERNRLLTKGDKGCQSASQSRYFSFDTHGMTESAMHTFSKETVHYSEIVFE